jgi:hypothetical protein
VVTVSNFRCQVCQLDQFTIPPSICEYRLQMAFKQIPCVLNILFGVGFGDSDAVKRFVEDGDDALLFEERFGRGRQTP